MRPRSLGIVLFSLLAFGSGASLPAQTNGTNDPVYRWTTLAGRASIGSEDGIAAAARFNQPHGLAWVAGSLYLADTGNHTIRVLSSSGNVSTVAGLAGASGSADGRGSAARFNSPDGLAADRSGNLYVADTLNHTIRKIAPDGTVTTIAGKAGQPGTTEGPVASALLELPRKLSVDSKGTVYFQSSTGLRKIEGGSVSVVTLPTQALDLDGQTIAISAGGLPAFDATDRPYFCATVAAGTPPNQPCVVRLDSPTSLTIVVKASPFGSELGWGERGIFNDTSGNLYVTHTLRGWAGTAGLYLGRPLLADGSLGAQVQFFSFNGGFDEPQGIAVDPANKRWFYTRTTDHAILDQDRVVVTGTPAVASGTDGTGTAARFSLATELTVDAEGTAWIADQNQRTFGGEPWNSYGLRRVDRNGAVTTPVAAQGIFENYSAGDAGVAVAANHVYFLWYLSNIRRLYDFNPATGTATRLTAGDSTLPLLSGLAAGPAGHVLSLAPGESKIYHVQGDGSATLFAGGAPGSAPQDGTGAGASFGRISALTADTNGNFYVLDERDPDQNYRYRECYVRKITASGVVTTIPKNLVRTANAAGVPVAPSGLAVDSHGTLYLSYSGQRSYRTTPSTWSYTLWQADNTIRRITPEGDDDVIGSSPGWDSSVDGNTVTARFASPGALVVDRQDNLYVLDGYGATLRKGEFLGIAPKISTQPQSLTVTAGDSAKFTVSASGTPAPQYQWHRNDVAISGATSDSLSIASAQAGDASSYTVVVTNSHGSITSAKATLTVNPAPVTPPPPPSGGGGGGGGGSGGGNNGGGASGGGGAPSTWFLLGLGALAAGRKLRRVLA